MPVVSHTVPMAAAGGENTEKAMKMAQQEMDYRVDLYNRSVQCVTLLLNTHTLYSTDMLAARCRMVASCYDKCMDKR